MQSHALLPPTYDMQIRRRDVWRRPSSPIVAVGGPGSGCHEENASSVKRNQDAADVGST